jgi:hypothetical protein
MSATIETRVAFAEHGDNQFRGYAVKTELAGRVGWAELIALAVGSRIDSANAALLEDAMACTLAADPRIWPLKVTRLVSSYGGALAGFCAGHLLLEEALMGPWPTGLAAELLVEIRGALGDATRDETLIAEWVTREIARGRKLAGFGVPFRREDERLIALKECVERRGRSAMPFWSLAMVLDVTMFAQKNVHANQSLALAALLLDLGFGTVQIPVVTTAMLDLCFYANAIEEASLASEILRRLPEEYVEYVGRAPRESPRAEAKRTLDSQAPVLNEPSFR